MKSLSNHVDNVILYQFYDYTFVRYYWIFYIFMGCRKQMGRCRKQLP